MLFKTKNKSIELDCFTTEHVPYELFKPDHARKFVPDWWKKLPSKLDITDDNGNMRVMPGKTMKTCHGFVQNFQHGLILPLWTDISVGLGPIGSKDVAIESPLQGQPTMSHPVYERGSYLNPDYYEHIKFLSPWTFKCKEDIKWSFQSPMWNFIHPDEILIPPGILDYKYQGATNINMFVKRVAENRIIDFEAGMPMAHIVPLTERKLVINHHLVSYEEMTKIQLRTDFLHLRSYDRLRKLFKLRESEKESKCPFSRFLP